MNDNGLDELMRRAREHEPFDTERAALGLETRLVARLRSMRENGEAAATTFWDDLRKSLWGSAAGLAPVVILLVIWLCVWSGFSTAPFAYDAVAFLEAYLPVDVF